MTLKNLDLSNAKEAARWRTFNETVDKARKAFADVPPSELQRMIDAAVEDVRAKRQSTD